MYAFAISMLVVAPPYDGSLEPRCGVLMLAPLAALIGLALVLACARRGSGNTIIRCPYCGRSLPIRPGSRYCPGCGGEWRKSTPLHNDSRSD